MIDLNKLKAAAEAAKAYQPDAIKAHSFGCFDEEGVFYELGNVCARIYDRDENSDGSSADDALLNHIIAASPDAMLELIAMASAAAPQVVADEADLECQIPPHGWRCTRGAGHDGPCAAVECPEDLAAVKRGMARLASAPVQAQEPVAFKEVGSFLYVGVEYVATSSDDPRGIKLYRPTVAPVPPVALPDGAGRGYSLGRSIIHECPALVLPQSFIQKLGGAAQIIPLRGMSDEAARQLVSDCNSAAPAVQGDAQVSTDDDYKEGDPGWRPACCDGGGLDSSCCDSGEGCAADCERAAIAAKAVKP